MAHFAKLSENNEVLSVEVVADSDLMDENNVEQEALGIQFLTNIHGWTKWKKCSYNTRSGKHYDADGNESSDQSKALRKNYPSRGYTYDETRDAFIPPRPYASWPLNESTCTWQCPVARPNTASYNTGLETVEVSLISWNETNQRWQATYNDDTLRWDSSNLNWVLI